MPSGYGEVAALMPPQYFIRIIKNIMIKGTGFIYVWKETLILIAFTVAFIGLSIRNFKIRLQ
jgi:ABC-2 type transport system permease protein